MWSTQRTWKRRWRRVRKLIATGVDAIKVHDGLTPEQIQAVVEEARALGIEAVVGHQYNGRESALAGLKYIEHSPPIARATISDPELQRLAAPEYYMEEALYDPLIELFLEQGVYINVPLWAGRAFNPASSTWGWEQLGPQLANDPTLAFVPQHERDSWLPEVSGRRNLNSLEMERRIAGMQKVKAFLKSYAEQGGKFVAGSDGGEEDVPGLWTHYEMQALVDAGLTPMQAILSATLWPAELFQLEDELGTIQVGRKADAIILTGNPLQNIAETRSILWVIKDGNVVDTSYDRNFQNPLPWTANADERGPRRGPEIATMAPVMAREGDAQVTLRIGGRDFAPDAVVRLDQTNLDTQVVSDAELVATIDRHLLRTRGTYPITVVNPGSGGGTSNTVYFLVDLRYWIGQPRTRSGMSLDRERNGGFGPQRFQSADCGFAVPQATGIQRGGRSPMKGKQFVTPVLVRNGAATVLRHIPFDDRTFKEADLQALLFEHPKLIPVRDIEPIFDGLLPLARELRVGSGFIDLVFMNEGGYLTLVETKLWRNPEARRTVVAQLVDYASHLSDWTYDELRQAVLDSRKGDVRASGDPLFELVDEGDGEVNEREFIDRVNRNLRLGRFVLLIVGDGIREGVEQMADFLNQTPQLQFTLGLVEMGLYALDPKAEPPEFYVQPRIVARTREVTRAVVEIKTTVQPDEVRVSVPPETAKPPNGPTERDFLDRLSRSSSAEVVRFAKWGD